MLVLIWLYWLCLLCCTTCTICHYTLILIIPFTTEIGNFSNNVSLWIYLSIKNLCCSSRRRTCWLSFKMWVHLRITWIRYWLNITLSYVISNHILTIILHIYERHGVYLSCCFCRRKRKCVILKKNSYLTYM